jgi:hypothetical protein
MLVKTARTFLTTLEEEYWDFRAVFLLPSRHTPLVKPPGLEPRFATPVPGRARLDPAQESLQVDALDTHGAIRLQDLFGLLVNRGADRTNGILYRSSGSESIAVGRESNLPLGLKDEFDEGLVYPVVQGGEPQRAPFVCSGLWNPHTSGGSADGPPAQIVRQGRAFMGRERLAAAHPSRVLPLIVLCDATDSAPLHRPRRQQGFLEAVDSSASSRVRGVVDLPFELEHRDLQRTPWDLVPCIRSRSRLAQDVLARLCSSPFRSTARPSADPLAFPAPVAADVIPSRAP